MGRSTRWSLNDRIAPVLASDRELSELAAEVLAAIGRNIPTDFGCLATTDPATGLITRAFKTRSLGMGDEAFSAVEYGPPDVNSFADIATRTPPFGALWIDTGGHPERCRRHREFMAPVLGFTDELRVVFRSRGVSWGALALYRGQGDPPFTVEEGRQVAAISEPVAEAIARSLFRTGPDSGRRQDRPADGPAVLVVDADDRVAQMTPAARDAVDELGGWDSGSLPASVLAAVARTRNGGRATDSRVQAPTGRWLSLRAAPLDGADHRRDVVVTVDAAPRGTLSRLALAAHGLTAREEEVALLVLQGASTRAVAATLHLSPLTVQDHLKKIFTKVGVTSRRDLTARLAVD